MKKLVLCVALFMLTGCGSAEPTTTQTTTVTTTEVTTTEAPTTTEAITEVITTEAKANKNDQFIDDLADGTTNFSMITNLEIIEVDDVKVINVKTKGGLDFITSCEILTATLQEADYYKGYDLWIRYVSGEDYVEWDLSASDNYEKGILSSSSTNPILNVTLDDIRDAFKNTEGQ